MEMEVLLEKVDPRGRRKDPFSIEYNVIYIGLISCRVLLQIRSRVSAIIGLSLTLNENILGILILKIK